MRDSRLRKVSKRVAAFTAGVALVAAGVFGGVSAASATATTPDPNASSVVAQDVSPSPDPTPTTSAPAPADTQQVAPAPAETTPAQKPAPAKTTTPSEPALPTVNAKVKTDSLPAPPTCVKNPSYTYTFSSATGSGVITVTGGKAGEQLCKPLYVRAVTYSYDTPVTIVAGTPSWPQTQVGYNDTPVNQIGKFTFSPPQSETCHQYDVHASFGGWEALAVPQHLLGSHNPYEPAFLHETLPGSGPNPTWSFTSAEGCNPPPKDVCKNIAGNQATVPAGFVQNGENCVPVHNECSASTVDASVWTTEDGAPTVGTDGIDFSTPKASDKVNYFGRTLNVPFAGISGGSYTVKNTGGPIAAYDFEVLQTGTSSFATVVFEPYLNGLTGTGTSGDGTFHTYVITGSSLVWNSKIASGEGSQAQPVTLTRMQELIPSATLIRAGLGQGRGNAGSLSTVKDFTDPACGHTVFPKKPVPVAPRAMVTHVCTADGPSITSNLISGTNATTFQIFVNGVQVEEHTVPAGATLPRVITLGEDSFGGSSTFEIKSGEVSLSGKLVISTHCNTLVVVHPENVMFHDSCGITDDSTNVPGTLDPKSVKTTTDKNGNVINTREYIVENVGGYTVTDTVTPAGIHTSQVTFQQFGNATIADPVKGIDTYKLVTEGEVTIALWTYTFSSTPCPTSTPTPTPTPTPTSTPTHPITPAGNGGAATGVNGSQPGASSAVASNPMTSVWGIGGIAAFIAALIALFVVLRKRSHNNGDTGVE